MSQFDVFIDVVPNPLVLLCPIPDFAHSLYTFGHQNRYCMHDMGLAHPKWSRARALPPHEVALGLYSTQLNVSGFVCFFFVLSLFLNLLLLCLVSYYVPHMH